MEKAYEPKEVEARLYPQWEAAGLFSRGADAGEAKVQYCHPAAQCHPAACTWAMP